MKHGPYEVTRLNGAWAVVDMRTGKVGRFWHTEREAEIDLARILIRNMMHG